MRGLEEKVFCVSLWVCLCPHLLFLWFSFTASVSLVRLYGCLSICLCHRLLCLFHLDGSVKSLYSTSNTGYLCLPSRVVSFSLCLKSLHFFFFFCLNGRKTSTYCVFNLSLLPHFLFILPSWKSRPPLGFIVSHVVLIFVFPAWVRYAADSFIWLCAYLHMRSRRHT